MECQACLSRKQKTFFKWKLLFHMPDKVLNAGHGKTLYFPSLDNSDVCHDGCGPLLPVLQQCSCPVYWGETVPYQGKTTSKILKCWKLAKMAVFILKFVCTVCLFHWVKRQNGKQSRPWSDCSSRPVCRNNWAASWQNKQNGMCAQQRLRSACMKKAWVLSYPLNAQRRLWSDWANAQADLSLRWAHSHLVGFVVRWLILRIQVYVTHWIRLVGW